MSLLAYTTTIHPPRPEYPKCNSSVDRHYGQVYYVPLMQNWLVVWKMEGCKVPKEFSRHSLMEDETFDYYREREAHTAQLAQELLDQEEELNNAEEAHDPARLCWHNLDGDDARCHIITGFTCEQFLELFEACEQSIPVTIGRGRRSRMGKHDRLLLVLCYLKHYETKQKLKETFLISKSQIHRNLDSTVRAIMPVLYEKYVHDINDLIAPDEELDLFPEARFVMDTTIQQIWTPIGTYEERKRYYSGKHQLYGLKTQTLHNRRGFILHYISGIPGATHDLTIARQNIEDIKPYLARPIGAFAPLAVEGEDEEQWAVIADSGYQGLGRVIRAIVPHKKAPGGNLTREQRDFNRRLASQRVICERWYGRLKTLFRITSTKYRNNRDDYPTYFALCAALTNYALITNPL